TGDATIGFAGAASGGDILFHEVCGELSVPTQVYLALEPATYVRESVQRAGSNWVSRFWDIYNDRTSRDSVRVLHRDGDLPAWLRGWRDYDVWQRCRLSMLFNALAAGGARNLTLISLWDGKPGPGPGDTQEMIRLVQNRGGRVVIISSESIFGLHEAGAASM